jgi:peptidoglycan/LPS O-acetylase OafA/YrhL
MSTVTGDQQAESPAFGADEAGTAPGDRKFRPDVEGLRAVAVLLVILYHASLPGLGGGYVGVDVFFVISGFVITGLLLRERSSTGRNSLVSFYGRRARRILPAATLVIITTVVATYGVLGVVSGNPTAIAARWTAVFLANFHFAGIGTDYLTSSQPPSPLQNFWSLAVEEQFYLVYPAIFLVAASIRSRVSMRVRMVIMLVPIIVISLLTSAIQTTSSPSTAYFSPVTRAWELALGALVAVCTPALLRLHQMVAGVLTWVGLAAIGYSAIAYSNSTSYPGVAVLVPVVGTALVIAGGSPVPSWGTESMLRRGPFQWFGRLSYSLYLWHWPILIIAAEAAGQNALPFHRSLGWLAVSVAAAYVTYRVVEDPVRHARRLARSRWLPIALGIVLVTASLATATVALALHGGNGPVNISANRSLTSYTPQDVRQLVSAAPAISSLPKGLEPALGMSQYDWGGPGPPCWPSFQEATVPACVFGDPRGTHTLALYGDSHAAMWFASINLIARISHWRLLLLAKGDCPALDLPFDNPPGVNPSGGEFLACDSWHRFALDRLRTVRPDLVIVSQDAEFGPGGLQYSPAQWERATESAIARLPVPAERIIILGDIPQHTTGGPECLSLHPTDVQKCSGTNNPYLVARNAAERRAAATTRARYVDTVPWFCSTTCTDVIGRFQPYRDPFHVGRTYSIVLWQVLALSIDLPSYALQSPSTVTSNRSTP